MVSLMQVGPAVDVRPVFATVRASLLELLGHLREEEWAARTVCTAWAVRDVAAHLLHDDLRRLSRTRDRYGGGPGPAAGQSLPEFLDAANQRWVTEAAFLSPILLVDLLAHTGELVEAMWAGADLDAPSEGIWWAGIDPAPVWLDLARDFTEDWIHQQQIRDAIGRAGLTDPRFLDPVLDVLLRALPHSYRHVPAEPGASVLVVLNDSGCQLSWSLHADRAGWTLRRGRAPSPTVRISMPTETLWRLATGGINRDSAARAARLEGDDRLAEPFFRIVSVIR